MIPASDRQPKLSTCPPLIPDRKGKKFTFLESVLIAQEKLEKRLTVNEFLTEMLLWAGRHGGKSERYLQNILNAYYLVGLIPYTQLAKVHDHQLFSTFVVMDNFQEIRLFCLTCMTERLDKMPQLWSIAPFLDSFDTKKLHLSLGVSFEDAKRRIRLLRNLGALQKVDAGYNLSPLVRTFAACVLPSSSYQIQPQETFLKETDTDDREDTFRNFIEW